MTSINIAMWSGPRNISTAMMRAWENRPDCEVWDEPLYAAYLQDSGVVHPMHEEILAANERDWERVVARCTAPAPDGSAVFYQKHMTHHMLPGYSRDWLANVQHCFLLRHPRDVLLSYSQKREGADLRDIGIVEQLELFERVAELQSRAPLIVDSQDFLSAPEAYLRRMCAHFGIDFYAQMLAWPQGQRDSDGVWGEHWYANVWRSTGFSAQTKARTELDPSLQPVLDAAMPAYEKLRAHSLAIET
ncbi:MAG: HAD family hydrolase [Pseudomonadota bacterium]